MSVSTAGARFLSVVAAGDPSVGGREALEVSLQRKGRLPRSARRSADLEPGLDPNRAASESCSHARSSPRTLAGRKEDPEAHLEAIRQLETRVEACRANSAARSAIARRSRASRRRISTTRSRRILARRLLAFTDADGNRGLLPAFCIGTAGDPLIDLVSTRISTRSRPSSGVPGNHPGRGRRRRRGQELGNIAWEMIWEPVTPLLPEDGPSISSRRRAQHPALGCARRRGLRYDRTTDLRILSARELLPSRSPRPALHGVAVLTTTPRKSPVQVLAEAWSSRRASFGDAQRRGGSTEAETAPPRAERAVPAGRFEAMRGISLGPRFPFRRGPRLLRAASSGLRGLLLAASRRQARRQSHQRAGRWAVARRYSRVAKPRSRSSRLDEPPRVLHRHARLLHEPNEELRQRS